MAKPLIIVFLGYPGSGKTYFSRQLAEKLQAVTLNSDALRVSMFGSLERIEEIRQHDRTRLYADVFGAMDYAARQALRAGHTVIYDAQQTKRENRLGIEKIAQETGSVPILVWIKTSRETAMKRGQEREARDDSNQYDAEKMARLIDRFESVTDVPDSNENVIEITGEQPFEEQFKVFLEEARHFRRE